MRGGKRASEEVEKENSERWLLTYSDMITLLLALFIILYGMSTEDQQKVQQMSEALSEALGGSYSVSATAGEGEGASTGVAEPDPLNSIYNQLLEFIKLENLQNEMHLEKTDHSITIQLRDSLLFEGNSTELRTTSISTLEKVSSVVEKVYDQVNHITITGNTADLGNYDEMNEADSWQLSVNRAVKVLNILTEKGLKPEKMSIEGNSHYNPVASNDTNEGRAANRRVEITITNGAN